MAENRKAELKVAGMVCAACTAAIEKALKNQEGVSRAEINLGTEIASVEYDPEKITLIDIEKAIRDAGYDVIDQKVVLKIGGMVCAMCVGALEIALKKLDGVVDVRVNLAAEKAYVTFNPRMVGLEDMKKAVVETGYQYLGVAGEETGAGADREREARELDLRDKKRRIIIGFATSLFLMAVMYLPVHQIIPMGILMAVPNFMNLFMLVVSATGIRLCQLSHLQGSHKGAQEQESGHGRHVRHGHWRRLRLQHPGNLRDCAHSGVHVL